MSASGEIGSLSRVPLSRKPLRSLPLTPFSPRGSCSSPMSSVGGLGTGTFPPGASERDCAQKSPRGVPCLAEPGWFTVDSDTHGLSSVTTGGGLLTRRFAFASRCLDRGGHWRDYVLDHRPGMPLPVVPSSLPDLGTAYYGRPAGPLVDYDAERRSWLMRSRAVPDQQYPVTSGSRRTEVVRFTLGFLAKTRVDRLRDMGADGPRFAPSSRRGAVSSAHVLRRRLAPCLVGAR